MSAAQSFRLALKSLAVSKMRSLLTMLGIIIGVAAVIVIISLGDGMNEMINSEFEKMGTNLLQVQIKDRGAASSISQEEMYALKEENPSLIAAMSPSVSCAAAVKTGAETLSTSVTGVGEEYLAVKSLELRAGRFIQYIDVERMQNVCVIGSYVDEEAFGGDGLGETLRLNGNEYTVVGILTEQADNTSYGGDNAVYIPYTNATRLNGSASISQYLFSAAGEEQNAAAKALIESTLERFYGDDEHYLVISMSEMMTMMGNIQGTVMTVLVAIAAISLLVGGIGIMNIMLVSVTERTREIGIRKSLGAKERYIMQQFVIEAACTSALGGIVGILIGRGLSFAASELATRLMGETLTVSPTVAAVALAFGISVGIGILFGYLPAKKAAGLNPIDALHYD